MCHFPINIKNPKKRLNADDFERIEVPCGKCNLCLKKRADQWFLRLSYELKKATSAYFVTLTYEDAPRTKNGLCTAKKSDLQDYFKRLRQREGGNNTYISYYASVEYGEKRHRPHYHIILFNVYDKNNITRAWSIEGKYLGFVTVSEITDARMRYVTGYIEKRVGIGNQVNDDRVKEFSLMSKKLGIHYVETATLYHTTTLRGYTQLGKRKFSLPRYYKDKMFPDHTITYDHQGVKFKVKSSNPIKKTISKINYDNFIQAQAKQLKNFDSVETFDHNRKCLAKRDNHELYSVLLTT